jgi:hypothetical protein
MKFIFSVLIAVFFCNLGLLFLKNIHMNQFVLVMIGAIVIVGGVILYAVISTATGMEEDANNNYIPDWIEKKFPSIFKSSKDLD